MIPVEAIEAASRAALGRNLNKRTIELILEAGAPILLAEAWGVARILAESRIEGDQPEEDLEWAKSEYRKRARK